MKKKGFLTKKRSQYLVNYKKTLSIIQNQILLFQILNARDYLKNKLLDVGCGERPYSLIYDELVKESISVDTPDSPHSLGPEVIPAKADFLPFKEDTFDTVLCTEVLEHTDDFFVTLSEIQRVLKPGGKLICSVPFMYPLHEFPNDNLRFTYFGVLRCLARTGLKPLTIKAKGGAGTFLVVLLFVIFSQLLVQLEKRANIRLFSCNIIRWMISFPQYVYSRLLIFFLRHKQTQKITDVSKYERFLSLGYFVIAEK
ncbi:MAG: class I SAM-dependent methyltransferase [Thermodesulfobacteriota bacterium]|nr:class I SAM-dependent methyltransferase [Thermodesulfobacteriota bacterium]